MRRRQGVRFNCFSPPVMVATMLVESGLAIYTVWRYKLTTITRLITASLLALATFQLAEYFVCTGYGLRAEQWSRVGFIAIATLPPLGIHMLHQLAHKPNRRLVYTAYATMAGFVGMFMLYTPAFIGHQCTGNYVIFQLGQKLGGAYYVYYYGWLLTGIILGVRWAKQFMDEGKRSLKKLETTRALIAGYLVFLVPTTVANTVSPQTKAGIPSIMCGFAVLFALIMAAYILPRVGVRKEEETSPEKHVVA